MTGRSLAALALLLTGAAVACNTPLSEPWAPTGVSLSLVGGDQQSGMANEELPQPLKVRVENAMGKPVRGQLVNFRVSSGGGRMFAGSSLTDQNGYAQDYWTLGPPPGSQTVDVVAVDPTSGAKQNFGTFTATVLAPAQLAMSPANHNFGPVLTGSTSAAQVFTVSNVGGVGTGPISITMAGATPGDFTIAVNTCAGNALAPGANCAVSVAFSPTAPGGRSASLSASASPGGIASSALSGTGVLPAVTISPTSKDFGSVAVGQTSAVQVFLVQNTSPAALVVQNTTLTGPHTADFPITLSGPTPCFNGATLGPSQTCTLNVAFRPLALGTRTATMTVLFGGGANVAAGLSGVGANPPTAVLSISPTSHNFGTTTVFTQGTTQQFVIQNVGQATSGPPSFGFTGANATDFVLLANPCAGVQLPAGASCAVTVGFVPRDFGTRTATLNVSASPGGTVSASLTGTGSL